MYTTNIKFITVSMSYAVLVVFVESRLPGGAPKQMLVHLDVRSIGDTTKWVQNLLPRPQIEAERDGVPQWVLTKRDTTDSPCPAKQPVNASQPDTLKSESHGSR